MGEQVAMVATDAWRDEFPGAVVGRRASARAGFTVAGAYPAGQEDHDLLRGDDPTDVAPALRRGGKDDPR